MPARNSLPLAEQCTGTREPDLRNFLDLAAMGTICDLAPLRGEVGREQLEQQLGRELDLGQRILALGALDIGACGGPRRYRRRGCARRAGRLGRGPP